MGVGCQLHAPAALPPRKEELYALYRRLGGTQGRSGQVRKMSPRNGVRSGRKVVLCEEPRRMDDRKCSNANKRWRLMEKGTGVPNGNGTACLYFSLTCPGLYESLTFRNLASYI